MMTVIVSQYQGTPFEFEKIGTPSAFSPGGWPTFWKPTWPFIAGMIVARMRTISPKPSVTMAR